MKDKIFKKIIIANNILAVLTLAMVAFLFWWVKVNTTTVNVPDTSSLDLAINYRKSLQFLQENYNDDVAKIGEELLKLRVPADWQAMHLDLIVAYNLKKEGKLEEAQNKIKPWQEKYSWLLLP